MIKPKILLSANLKKEDYIDAVNSCGGIAVAEYCPEASADGYDGLILCGGNDINPAYYNEETNGAVNMDNERDEAEFSLLKAFIDAKKPVMGICRGCQLLNIAFGGTLYQDIDNVREHRSSSDYYMVHNVKASEKSFIHSLYGDEFSVNSFHHQAICEPGDGFDIIMTAHDGTAEGICHKSLPVFGVQWHPERMCFSHKRNDAVDGKYIFEYFINLCLKESKDAERKN